MDPEIKSFVIEQWAEYGAITLILCSRLAVRIRVQGFRRLDGDDYLSVLAFWTEKLCILFLLKRLTRGLWVERLVKPMMAIVVTCYLIIVVVVTTYCIPFHNYWQIYPDPGTRCHPDTTGLYVAVLVMNCLTDLGIAAIPIPLLRHARMHWAKKIGIAVILCASVFTMIAAIMRVYFSMTGKVGAAPAFWACRECLVSCFVVNAPIFVAVFRSSFWRPSGSSYGSYFGSSGKGRRAGAGNGGGDGGGSGQVPAGHTELEDRKHAKNRYRHPHEMDTWLAHDRTIVDCEATSSTERIHQPQAGGPSSDDGDRKIHVKRDVRVQHTSSG
ncbi:hypothetical protein PG991_012006 [Apiospora marii]|uniref:Rhodopsin domain-containing protein n=1 Tax=Apiospora marii TaxID=335849 RepID=A0ABR1RG61_9PEZI